MKKTRHLVIAIVAVAIVLGIGAVGAYAGMAGDATPPVTTSDVALSYTGDVAFSLNATDAEGVAYIYHRFDKGVARLYTVATDTVHPAVAISAPTAADTPMSSRDAHGQVLGAGPERQRRGAADGDLHGESGAHARAQRGRRQRRQVLHALRRPEAGR